MPTWTPSGKLEGFPDTLIPGYTGYQPIAVREPGLALGKMKITQEPWLGEFQCKEKMKQVHAASH